MFGISLYEILVIILFAIIIIKPKDYKEVYIYIKKLFLIIKSIYKKSLIELERIKQETGITQIDKKLLSDIENIDSELKNIIGDDGKEYQSYKVDDLNDLAKKKNE